MILSREQITLVNPFTNNCFRRKMYHIPKDLIDAEDFSVSVCFFFFKKKKVAAPERDTTETYRRRIEKFRIQPEIRSQQSASQV